MVSLKKVLVRAREVTAPLAARPPGSAADASLGDIISVLLRRKWSILIATATLSGIAFAYTLAAPRLYTAAAAVLLELRSSVSQQDTLRFSFASDSTLVDSQIKIMSSETVLRRVVERENLRDDAEFGTPELGIFARLKRAAGLAPPVNEQAQESTNAAIESLAKALSVRRPERTYVMELNITAKDPKKAARLTNAVAEAYIADQADARGDIARREEEFLESNITKTREKIRTAENNAEQYKRTNQIVGASGKLVNEQLLTEVNTELAQTRAKTAEAKSRAEQIKKILASGRSVDGMADALKSPVIDKLRVQFAEISRNEANAKTTLGERHPQYLEIQQQLRDTRRLITEELNRIAEGARNDQRVAQAQEDNLAAQIEQLKTETSTTNQAIVNLRELEREVETNRAVLDNLLKAKGNLTRDSADMPVARIIARATPPVAASSPRRIPIMLLAMFSGIALGVISALLMEHFKHRRGSRIEPRTGTAVHHGETQFPVTILPPPSRLIANVRAKALLDQNADPAFSEVTTATKSDYSQAMTRFAAHAIANQGDGIIKMLIIGHGDANDTALFTANFAQALAHAGCRTMVVDNGDTNAPLCRVWSADSKVGRVDFTNGAQRIAISIANDDKATLLIVPAEASPTRIERLPQLLGNIETSLDCIIFSAGLENVQHDARLLLDASLVIIHGKAIDGVFDIQADVARAVEVC